jgi:hypothetical protein
MLRNIMITGTAIGLSMSGNAAKADHGDAVRYVVAGAVIGAALGELAYVADHRRAPPRLYVDHGRRWGGVAYASSRYYAPPRVYRHRSFDRRLAYDRGYRHGHRHGRYCH